MGVEGVRKRISRRLRIADELFISVNTVKDHIKHIYAKTGYSRSLQVVVDAVEHKLILPNY